MTHPPNEERADVSSLPRVPSQGPFEQFYRSQFDRVYRALALTLGDTLLAHEAADEAMARAYTRWGKVSRLQNPGGWVFRVGLNWASSWRRKIRRERPIDVWATAVDVPSVEPTAHYALDALARLPQPQRSVIVCRVLLELSTTESATALGIAEGTVKSRLARGLATLRTALIEEMTE